MIMTTILTHPFHLLLAAMVLIRLVRLARSGGGEERAAHSPSIPTLEHRQAA
jgi:hypothetical protein